MERLSWAERGICTRQASSRAQRRLGALGTLAILLATPIANGQSQSVISGRVTSNGNPVASAEVFVDGPEVRARTSDSGSYRIVLEKGGAMQVFVRRFGFAPAARNITISDRDSVTVDFALTAVAQPLDSVTVEANAPATSPRMIGFEDRRRAGIGHFITRETLATQEHSIVSNVLRKSNIKLVPRPGTCGGGHAAATGRGGSMNVFSPACGRVYFVAACYATVFFDGVPIWAASWGSPPPDVNQFKVIDLEAVEVYRSATEVPLQFSANKSPCGAVLFWTRTGHK